MPEFRTLTTEIREITVYVTADDLRTLVGAPKDATVQIRVPGGADRGNTELGVSEVAGDDQCVRVTYKQCLSVTGRTQSNPADKADHYSYLLQKDCR